MQRFCCKNGVHVPVCLFIYYQFHSRGWLSKTSFDFTDAIFILQRCLTRDPKERPSIEELLQHEYLHSLWVLWSVNHVVMDMPFIWLYQILLCVARLQSQSMNENDCQPFGWNMQTWVQCLRVTCFLYGKFGFDFMLHWIVMWSFQHFHIREINSSCFYNVWAMTAFLLQSTWILSWLYYFV